ncbi:MAG: ABC transporter permease, partial [Bacteroidales bacterium]|nr:ABC transporter permease [Bacteroidales bacterium]
MSAHRHKHSFTKQLTTGIKDTYSVFINEFRAMFKDRGVVIIFMVASLVYPILYCGIYKNETLENVPIAAVDQSQSPRSAELLRHIDASKDLSIAGIFTTMEEARMAFDARKVHGIVFIPADFE